MVAAELFLEDAAGSETDATGGLYPPYMPMDEFVDVEGPRPLGSDLNQRIPRFTRPLDTSEKRYVEGCTTWFDEADQYYGSDAGPGLTFSIRVDGRFTEVLKKQIPYSTDNPASTPAIWTRKRGGQA